MNCSIISLSPLSLARKTSHGPDVMAQPRPPATSRSSVHSTTTRRVRVPSPVRRPLPPGPGPLDDKGEKLILKPIDNAAIHFRPRKSSEKTSNAKPLRAIHSVDRQYIHPDSDASMFQGAATAGSQFVKCRSKSYDDINQERDNLNRSNKFLESQRKLQPLNYRSANFGSLSDTLARGGSPLSRMSSYSPVSVETKLPYFRSYPVHSLYSSSSSSKPRRESYGGFNPVKIPPVCKRSSSLGADTSPSIVQRHGTLNRPFVVSRETLVKAAGVRGLQNVGNTCYQATIYQCLSHTVRFREFCLHKSFESIINPNSPSNGKMIQGFTHLLQALWTPVKSCVPHKPSAMKKIINRNLPFFANFMQHDAQEFLRAFIDALHEDINKVHSKPCYSLCIDDKLSDYDKFVISWKRQLSRENSWLSELFVGMQRSTLCCLDCGHRSLTFEAFWDLSLQIPVDTHCPNADVSLSKCLESYCTKEILDGENRVTCDHCKQRTKQQKWLRIERFPQILVLHLKRFTEGAYSNKVVNLVRFPLKGLTMEKTTDMKMPPTFNLYAVANHEGTRDSGHYVAYVLHSTENSWFVYDDAEVGFLSSSSSVISQHAYILFYDREHPSLNEK